MTEQELKQELSSIKKECIGVIYFPMILAIDIWNKLNNEE